MDSTSITDGNTSTPMHLLPIPPPYKESVVWPDEFTVSISNDANVRAAFQRTYERIKRAGCHFLLLEPTPQPQSYVLLF